MFEAAILGIVAGAPERRVSPTNGKVYAPFSVGIEKRAKPGTDRPSMEWVRVTIFGDLAEQLSATLTQGNMVYAEGHLTLDRWTSTKDGSPCFGASLAAWKCEVLPGAGAIGRNRPRNDKHSDGERRENQ
jgi:single-stranded DNA-binding protein